MLSVPVFIFALFIAFYIPGNVLLFGQKIRTIQRISAAFIIGIMLWALQGYVFGFLHLRWATYVYLAIFISTQLYFWIKKGVHLPVFHRPSGENIALAVLILIGVITLSSSVFPFGIQTRSGFLLCCGDVRDNFIHLAYIQEVIKNIPPLEPGLTGAIVRNYHYGMHIVIGEFLRIFKLPIVDTTMRYFPPFLSLLLALTALSIAQSLKVSKAFKFWFIFFLFFAGDFIYGTHLLLGHGLSFASYVQTDTTLFVNYPFGFSIIIAFGALNLFILSLRKPSLKLFILTGLVIGFVTSIKVNTGLFMMSGLVVLSIYGLYKKQLHYSLLCVLAMATSILLLYPANSQSAGGLFYSGFWRVQDYIVQPAFGLSRLELARKTYEASFDWIKVFMYNVIFLGFYFITVMGMNLIGFFVPRKQLQKVPKEIHIYLISSCVISGIIGLFFLQNPGGANSMFFITAALVMVSFYAALASDYWTGKWKRIQKAVAVGIICFTVPTSVYFVYADLRTVFANQSLFISTKSLESFAYIREHTPQNSTILVLNDALDAETPYVHFFTERQTYLSGQNDELTAHSIDFRDRQEVVNQIYQSSSSKTVVDLLKRHAIDYIILNSRDNIKADYGDHIKIFFQNPAMKVLQVI